MSKEGDDVPPVVGPTVTLSEPARWELGEYVMEICGPGGVALGQISYRNLDRARGRAELGIELQPQHRGHGYGTEAIRLLLNELFEGQGLKMVYLRVHQGNQPARRAYERVGFRYARTVRWPVIGIVRHLVMEIRRSEFSWTPTQAPH